MNIFKDIIFSHFSPRFYADVAKRSGYGLIHITVLAVISVILLTVYMMYSAENLNAFSTALPKYASALPVVTVKSGKLSIDRPDGKFTLPLGDEKNPTWAIVDTGYKANNMPALKEFMQKSRIAVLVTADNMIELNRYGSMTVTYFLTWEDMQITRADWQKMASQLTNWGLATIAVVIFVISLIIFEVYIFVVVFLTALLVMMLAVMMRAQVHFGVALRLAAAAYIPFNIITNAPLAFGQSEITGAVSWFIWFAYLIFAVYGSKRQAF